MRSRLHCRMPMLQARALDGKSQESGRFLHPGNAVLRRAIQENLVSFPSQIPVFSRLARPEMQWKAVLLYFVHGWPICDIAARFTVGAHRIQKAVEEWATRAIALGYIQVIDPDRFAAWCGMPPLADSTPGLGSEPHAENESSAHVSRSSLGRLTPAPVASGGNTKWRNFHSVQPTNIGLVTALDLAIRRCEGRPGKFFGQAATLLRDLRAAVEASDSPLSASPSACSSVINNLRPVQPAPAEEVLYAFNS
jgi:hypothetical protein